MNLKEFVENDFARQVLDLAPDGLIFAVRQVKESGKKQWHYFYLFDDANWGADEDVVGAAYTLLNHMMTRRSKLLHEADAPNKGVEQ